MNFQKIRINNVLYVLSFSAFFFACETGVQEEVDLRENEAQRNAVYDQILNDEELFRDFMNRMSQNDQSIDWMVSNRDMMQEMYSREHMQTMMRENPQMMNNMMQEMMAAMQRDTTMMHQNPAMRERMMENMMNMMQQDTAMYNQMQQRMQQPRMGGTNRIN